MVETIFLLEICEYQSHPEVYWKKFKRSSVLPNTKDNCAVLFWTQLHWLFRYASKYIFLYGKKILIESHVKISGRNY